MNQREQLLEDYRRAPDAVREALRRFPAEMWKYRMDEKSWSVHEILIHLCDSDIVSSMRCRRIIAENGAELEPYNQNAWVRELDYHAQDPQEALDLMSFLRKYNYKMLKSVPELIWATHNAFHMDLGAITLDDWLSIYARHPYLHIEQMERIHDAWKESRQ